MEIAIIVVIFFILSNIGKKNRLSKGQNKPEERVPERRTPTPNKPGSSNGRKIETYSKTQSAAPKGEKDGATGSQRQLSL